MSDLYIFKKSLKLREALKFPAILGLLLLELPINEWEMKYMPKVWSMVAIGFSRWVLLKK